LAPLLLLCTAHCSPPAPASPPTVSVERSEALDTDFITIESDTLVDGKRPTLTLVCGSGETATFQMNLVRPPSSPPPLRGVFAQMQVKGGPKVTIELGWLDGAAWAPRMPHSTQPDTIDPDLNNQERVLPILHAFSRERALTITPPAGYGPDQEIVFSPRTFGPHLPAAQRCAALNRFPDRAG